MLLLLGASTDEEVGPLPVLELRKEAAEWTAAVLDVPTPFPLESYLLLLLFLCRAAIRSDKDEVPAGRLAGRLGCC